MDVRSVGPNARWHDALDTSRLLMRRRYFPAALKHLEDLERELAGQQVEPRVWYRLYAQRATCLFHMYDSASAIASGRRALEHQPHGVEALRILTQASLELRQPAEALVYAQEAVTHHPDDVHGWIAMAHVSASTEGQSELQPPAAVNSSHDYQVALCGIDAQYGRWQELLERTAPLLAGGPRDTELLFFRAQALHNTAEQGPPDARTRREDAIRLLNELIERVNDPANDLTRVALVVRTLTHMALDHDAEAEADVTLALERYGDKPDVLRIAAIWRGRQGDAAAVLQVLRHPVVDREPALLILRAQALMSSDRDAARRTLNEALRLLPPEQRDDDFRLRSAMVALDLEQTAVARELLDGIVVAQSPGQLHIALGQLAVAEGRFADAEAEFEAAAVLKPSMRSEFMTSLAFALSAAGDRGAAVRILRAVGDGLPDGAQSPFLRLLFAEGDFQTAASVIDRGLRQTPRPTWALGHGAWLAQRQSNPEGAHRLYAELDARGALPTDGRIQMTLCLVQLGRTEEARSQLENLRASRDLTGMQLMQVAELLSMIGSADAAIPLAYRAARLLPDDPDIQRAFAILAMVGGRKTVAPEQVRPDTHVVLRNAAGVRRRYTVLSDEPIDPQRHEITVDDARARGLLELKLGDVRIDNEGHGYLEERWTVERIAPAAVAAAHEVAETFPERFRDQPFFVRAFQFSEGTLTEFLPFIQSMEEHRKHVTNLLTLYREQAMPLGVMAQWLSVSIADLVEDFRREPLVGELYVEWADQPGREAARQTAAQAKALVLTHSALATAQQLELLPLLPRGYTLVAPTSLVLELRSQLDAATQDVVEGRDRLMPDAALGFALRRVEEGDATLTKRRDDLRALLAWVEANVRQDPRPPDTLGVSDSEREDLRNTFGASSFDALALVPHLSAPLYADDLGLRRFATATASCSTVTLLEALNDRGVLAAPERNELLLKLVLQRYVTIPPRSEVLLLALNRPTLTAADLERVFDLLKNPLLTLAEAADVGAAVIRGAREGMFRQHRTRDVARLVLRSMMKGFKGAAAPIALRRAAEPRLQFFPEDLQELRAVCAHATASALSLPTKTSESA